MIINIDYLNEIIIVLLGSLDKFIIALIVIMIVNFITILFRTYYSKDILRFDNDNIKKD